MRAEFEAYQSMRPHLEPVRGVVSDAAQLAGTVFGPVVGEGHQVEKPRVALPQRSAHEYFGDAIRAFEQLDDGVELLSGRVAG